ncbi:MAG: GGDEF domain-containing protein [Woeseia sp.]
MEGPYLRELENKRAGLQFANQRVESEYQSYAARRHSDALRIQLLLGGLMICANCLLDFLLLDGLFARTAIMLRLGVMLPPIILMYALTWLPNGQRYLQSVGVVVGLAIGLTSLAIGAVAEGYGAPQVFASYQIVTVFVYFFLGLRVPLAIATSLILFFTFVFVAAYNDAPLVTTAYNGLYLAFLNIIGALGCYQLSKARRTVFLEERVLSYQANHDALTGLPNRRAFDTLLETAWENARAMGKPVSLLMMDIDHFKNYNDLYGHQAGDHAISAVGAILGKSLQRPQDFAGRYGGEEFVVLLFDATKEYAMQLAEKVREQVLARNIAHRGSSVARCVSLSIGLAHIDPSQSKRSMEGFVQMADEALYAAKEQGRNCVVDADLSVHVTSTGMFRVMKLDETGGVQEALAATGKR